MPSYPFLPDSSTSLLPPSPGCGSTYYTRSGGADNGQPTVSITTPIMSGSQVTHLLTCSVNPLYAHLPSPLTTHELSVYGASLSLLSSTLNSIRQQADKDHAVLNSLSATRVLAKLLERKVASGSVPAVKRLLGTMADARTCAGGPRDARLRRRTRGRKPDRGDPRP